MKACMDLDIKLQVLEEENIVKDIDGIQLFNEITPYKDIFSGIKQAIEILEIIVKNDLIPRFPNFALAIIFFFNFTCFYDFRRKKFQ